MTHLPVLCYQWSSGKVWEIYNPFPFTHLVLCLLRGRYNFCWVFSHDDRHKLISCLREKESNDRLMFYDTSGHQTNLSPTLLFLLGITLSSPTTAQSKASHCICVMHYASPYYSSWDFLLPFKARCLCYRPRETSQAVCSSALQLSFPLQKAFLHLKAAIMLPLELFLSLNKRVNLIVP